MTKIEQISEGNKSLKKEILEKSLRAYFDECKKDWKTDNWRASFRNMYDISYLARELGLSNAKELEDEADYITSHLYS